MSELNSDENWIMAIYWVGTTFESQKLLESNFRYQTLIGRCE